MPEDFRGAMEIEAEDWNYPHDERQTLKHWIQFLGIWWEGWQ